MISKIDMIRDEIEYYQERLTEIKIKRTKLLELLFEEMKV